MKRSSTQGAARPRRVAGIVIAAMLAIAGRADAGRLVVVDTYAEADLADQAGAVTLLLRAALDRPGHAVVTADELRAAKIPLARLDQLGPLKEGLAALGADGVIACELARAGVGVRGTLLAIDKDGVVVAAGAVVAGDGDVTGLATALLRLAAPLAGNDAVAPSVSVGQLRPFVWAAAAIRRGDLAGAARDLAPAEPLVPLKVPSIGVTLRPGWAGAAADQPTALAIAQAAGTPKDVLDLAPGNSPRERAARAMAKLSGAALDDAAAELAGRSGRDPWLDIAAARLAHARGERQALAAAARRLLATATPSPSALAMLASLPAAAVPPEVEDAALVQARSDPRWARLASVLGLHVAQRSAAALAAIRVVELDDSEVSQLEPLARRAAAAGDPQGLRLTAELAARGVDPKAIAGAVERWANAAPGDPGAQLLRGRLALAAARLDEARDAFAAAQADRELARVAIARRDWATAGRLLATAPDDSVEKRLVAAQLALADGDTRAALTAIESALELAPSAGEALRARALLLERGGDAPSAAQVLALADKLAPSTVSLTLPTRAASPDQPIVVDAPPAQDLDAELAAMIAALPLPPRTAVAIAGVRASRPGWLSLREVRDAPIRTKLAAQLAELGFIVVGAGAPVWTSEPLERERLDGLAADLDAPTLVLYRLRTDGARAELRLIAFDRATGTAQAVDRRLDGTRVGLVRWNTDRIVVAVGLAVVLIVLALVWFIRGRSRIVVQITLDPDGSDEALAIEVSRLARRPVITDPVRWRRDAKKAGHEITPRSARLPTARTTFPVPSGPWYVHVYGVYTREYGERVVPPLHSRQVDVARGATATVEFDLGLPVAEVKVTIHDAKRGGIGVWLDNGHADRVYTDADGQVTLYATVGQHTLHIDAPDLRIERPLQIMAAQIEKVIVNLPRERRLAEVSEGLSLTPAPERRAGSSSGGFASSASTTGPITGPITGPVPRESMASLGGGASMSGGASFAAAASMGGAPAASGPIEVLDPLGGDDELHEPSAPIPQPVPVQISGPIKRVTRPQPITLPPPTPIPGSAAVAAAAAAAIARSPLAAAEAVTAPAPSATTLLAPEPGLSALVAGRYRIDGELGRGAMGVVFKAWDTHLERDVAVKVLARAVREIPDALTFFVKEAKALAQLNHPNIVAVHDQISDGTENYMIMEYVDGITVERLLIDRGRLALRPALGLIDQLCAGLGYAHGKKIIHRDIKPANVFISREKIVKLGDFGLARVMREIEIRQTDVRGTPLYMAPEQVIGTNINHRADLYAVGCTLFELIAGRPPFVEGNILHHHVMTPPPRLSQFVPDVPPALDALIAACLAKDSAERIESAQAIQERVRAIAASL